MREESISDIADDMEQLAIATSARDIEGNECEGEVDEVTAPPPSLAQLQAMFGPIQESAFYVTYRMRVLTFRELLIYLERQFAGITQTQRGSCSLLRCFLDVPSLSDNKIRLNLR